MKKRIIIGSISIIVVLAGVAAYKFRYNKNGESAVKFETVVVKRGKISNTVNATGTLEAVETVEVGTQVSGVIRKILVDFNSEVKKGQVLAQIDEKPLLAQLQQSKATLDDARAELNFQTATFKRDKALFEKKLISQADFDQVTYNYNKAKANLLNAQAIYDRNKINLNYATIASPIDGVVLNRAVDQGQTVAASFNTPTLFSIANDLTQMRVEASVDEADIGQVKKGQRVEFTVDAYPDEIFTGEITEVRLQPMITSNVVTYTVIINAPNPDKKLMPGMTATTTIFVQESENDLLIPMQATRFIPDPDSLTVFMPGDSSAQYWRKAASSGNGGKQVFAHSNEKTDNMVWSGENFSGMQVWIKKEGSIFPVHITININDGVNYGLKSGLQEGDTVILSASANSSAGFKKPTTVRSPFMPTPPGRR